MINWGSLLVVQLVSVGATVAVVGLVSLAVLSLPARGGRRAPAGAAHHPLPGLPARSGTLIGATCLVLAASIVLFGLWEIVAR